MRKTAALIWVFFNVSVYKNQRGQAVTFLASFPLSGIAEEWAQLV